MKKTLLFAAALLCSAMTFAQSLTTGKTVATVGDALTWTKTVGDAEETKTFDTESLAKLVTDGNNDNVFLLPEWGLTDADAIQAFYVDFGESVKVGAVKTRWEGAACSFKVYMTDVVPTTTEIPEGANVAEYANNGQEINKDVNFATPAEGQYLVFIPVKATNPAWGVKMRGIEAYGVSEELASISLATTFVSSKEEIKATAKNEFGAELTSDEIVYTVDGTTLAEWELVAGVHTLKATLGENEATTTFVVLNDVPALPTEGTIVPFYTSTTVNDWALVWNGGCTLDNNMTIGETPVKALKDLKCVFIASDAVMDEVTANNVNWNINPTEKKWLKFVFNVYSPTAGQVITAKFADAEEGDQFTLKQGWNTCECDLTTRSVLSNFQVRGDGTPIIAIANAYFVVGEQDASGFQVASLEVTPALIGANVPTELTFVAKNAKGVTLTDGVTYTAEGLEGNILTATEGKVTITATTTAGEETKTATADVTVVPACTNEVPETALILWNGKESTIGDGLAGGEGWEGGYKKLDNVEIAEGVEALHASNVKTLYIPKASYTNEEMKGVTALVMDVYSSVDANGIVLLQEGIVAGTPQYDAAGNARATVKAGEWTRITLPVPADVTPVTGWTKLKMFAEATQTDDAQLTGEAEVLVANLYYSKDVINGINNIDANETVNNGAIYNLAGQRVSKATKGVYIINGKKVIVK